jgi:hypothetical protein
MTETQQTQRIAYYADPVSYQQLGADCDIQTYHEFVVAFDTVAATCRARKQAFERVYVDVPVMLQWLRDNKHQNNNAGLAAYSKTLNAIHPSIDRPSPQQSFAAANFASVLGPTGLGGINYAAMPHVDPFRR